MRVLVCGSRDWTDRYLIATFLQGVYEMQAIGWLTTHAAPLVIVSGGAPGADAEAKAWATTPGPHPATLRVNDPDVMDVLHEEYLADWASWGKSAGPVRNQRMLDEGKPGLVLAFVNKPLAESRGTADMVRRAVAAGVVTYVIERAGSQGEDQ